MSAAAPGGTPPRRNTEKARALPCPAVPRRGLVAGGHRNCFCTGLWEYRWRLFGTSRNLCKVMAYYKKDDEKDVKWYATEIMNDNGAKHSVWLLQEPTGWR